MQDCLEKGGQCQGSRESDDGATFWRKRTFRRGENMALDRARHCVGRVLEDRRKLESAQQPAAEPAAAQAVNPFTW